MAAAAVAAAALDEDHNRAPRRRNTLPPDTETFDFSNNDPYTAKTWLRQIEMTAKICKISEADWPIASILKLRGIAQVWGLNLNESSPDITWPEFKLAFGRQFGTDELESNHRNNLAAVVWEKGDTPNS
ncbi:hypothetical protein BGZ96_006003, partial [Linnemannia gamsii]